MTEMSWAINQEHLAKFKKTNMCLLCDLSKADFRNENLENAVLRGTNLSGSNLNGANLTNADLNGANLIGADLSNAILLDSDIVLANPPCAVLIPISLIKFLKASRFSAL